MLHIGRESKQKWRQNGRSHYSFHFFIPLLETIKPQVILLHDILWSNSGGGRGNTYVIRPFLKSKSTNRQRQSVRQLHSSDCSQEKKNERGNKRTKYHWRQLTVNEKQSLCCLIIFSIYIFLNWKILILPIKSFSKESRSLKEKKNTLKYFVPTDV